MLSFYGVFVYFNEWIDGRFGEIEFLDNYFELKFNMDKDVDVLKLFVSIEEFNFGNYIVDFLKLGFIEQIKRGIGVERVIGDKSVFKKDDWFIKIFIIIVFGN